MASEDSFFSRWSRRKAELAPKAPAASTVLPPAVAVQPPVNVRADQGRQVLVRGQVPEDFNHSGATPPPVRADGEPPSPTLDDAAALTPESDFKPFMQRSVAPEVKNAAMKKLFADPHFNIMDGLDTYIDDYSQPSPLSAADLKSMVAAQFIKLVEEEVPPPPAAVEVQSQPLPVSDESPPGLTGNPSTQGPETHDHPDLQLQPDHAARRPGAEPGA